MTTSVEVGDWIIVRIKLLDGCAWRIKGQTEVYARVVDIHKPGYRARKNSRSGLDRVVTFEASCCTPRVYVCRFGCGRSYDYKAHTHRTREGLVTRVDVPKTLPQIEEYLDENTR